MDKINSKLMMWKDGKLLISPQGKAQFFYWRSFDWLVRLHNVKLKQWNIFEQRLGLFEKELKHSDGWFAYQILRDIEYQIISEKEAKRIIS